MNDTAKAFSGPEFYDRCLGPAWLDAHGEELARRVSREPPGDALEIACGTGAVTRFLRERLDPARLLVATDVSEPMLDYARAKLARLPGIEWRRADALDLPFGDARFGAVACGLGVMFVPDRRAALAQIRRVLVPGGELVFNVWDRLELQTVASINAEVVESFFPGDPEMRFRMPYDMHDPVSLRELVAGCGFRDVSIEAIERPIRGADPRALAEGQIRGTPRSALIEKRGVALAAVIDRIAARLEETGGNPYNGSTRALLVAARAA